MFVKAKFITSSAADQAVLIGFRQIWAFCQGQSPTFDDRARSLHRHQWSESEANVRPKFGTGIMLECLRMVGWKTCGPIAVSRPGVALAYGSSADTLQNLQNV